MNKKQLVQLLPDNTEVLTILKQLDRARLIVVAEKVGATKTGNMGQITNRIMFKLFRHVMPSMVLKN